MVGSSDGVRRLLAVIAIGCAIGGILLASSAMPMLAGDTPAASVLGEEGVAAEHERAVQQALLGSALEHGDGDESVDESALEDIDGSDIEDGEMDPEEVERAIEEGDIDPEAFEEGFEDGDSSDLELGGGSLPAGAMAAGAGGDGGLEGDVTRAAVLTGMELQGDKLTDPQMSDALFGLGAIYAAMGGSTDGLPANADLEAEGDLDDSMTEDGLGGAETSAGGLFDVPTSSSGLDGGFGDAVGEGEDVVTEEGMDFDGTADGDEFDGDSSDADGFDTDGSDDGTESDEMDGQESDDGAWEDGDEEPTDDSEQHDEDSETDDGETTADDGDTTTENGDDADEGDTTSDNGDDSSTETDDSSADDDGSETDGDSAGIDDGDSGDDPSTDEADEGSDDSSDDDSSDDDEGFVASLTESLGPLGDRPLLTAVLAVVVVVVAYVFLTKDDPIATLRAIPGRLVSLVMSTVVACSQLLERAVSALTRVTSVAEIPGLIVTALVGALASMRQKATDVRASLPIVGDSGGEAAAADIDEEIQSSARERIRGSFYRLESLSTVYPLSVATPTDVAHDVKAQGAPAEPVDTIADAFRDVEYGDRDPERRLEQTTEAEAALQAALEQSAGETDDSASTEPTGPTEDR